MAHRAAVYSVRVRPFRKPTELRRLGDIDGAGTYLGDRIAAYLGDDEFRSETEDRLKVVRCESGTISGDEVRVVLTHGQTGVDADILDPRGATVLHHQDPHQIHQVRCLSLFVLPPAQAVGWLAVHVNNGRSAKHLLTKALEARLKEDSDLVLQTDPFVEEAALWKAVEDNRIDKVVLRRTMRPEDREVDATDKWISRGDTARLELTISIPERAKKYMIGALLRKFRNQESGAIDQILEFDGLTFDQAKVEVELENGTTRTFNIEKPDAGHAFTTDMQDLEYEDEVPTDESVFKGLADALSSVAN